eukprot:2696059-Ditylum_brightwellii.AAC.1
METCVYYKECKPKETKENKAACKSYSKRGESINLNTKLVKKLTMTGDKVLYDIILMTKDVTIANTMGIATTPQKS